MPITRRPLIEMPKATDDWLSWVIAAGLLAVLVFTTLAYGAVESWSIAIFGFLITILLTSWMARGLMQRRLTLRLPAATSPVLGLIVLGVLQSITFADATGRRTAISMDAEATRLTLEVLVLLFIGLLIAANFFDNEPRLALLRNFLIIFGLALAVFGLIQHFTWNGKYYWVFAPSTPPPAPFGPFVNHNHFAGYLEMIVPIPVALILLRAVYAEMTLLYSFAAAMMSVAIFLSLSRGGMISLLSGLLFVVGFGCKPALERMRGHGAAARELILPRLGVLTLLLLTIGIGVWWTGADAVLNRVERTELTSEARRGEGNKETFFQSRGWIWRDTLAMIRANWKTGVGLGAFATAYPIYSSSDGSLLVSQAHNDYLQIVADGGVIGGLLALWFIVAVFRDFARALGHRDEMMAGLALGCGGGVFALLVHSLFDFNLQLPSNALLFLVLVAVIAYISSAAAESRVGHDLVGRWTRPALAA